MMILRMIRDWLVVVEGRVALLSTSRKDGDGMAHVVLYLERRLGLLRQGTGFGLDWDWDWSQAVTEQMIIHALILDSF